MKFNSNSVIFKKGNLHFKGIDIPPKLIHFKMPLDVWDNAIIEFNKELNDRSQVTTIIEDIHIDIIKVVRNGGSFELLMLARQDDIKNVIDKLTFTFKGILIKDKNTKNIKRMVIDDLLYGPSVYVTKSILKKRVDILKDP